VVMVLVMVVVVVVMVMVVVVVIVIVAREKDGWTYDEEEHKLQETITPFRKGLRVNKHTHPYPSLTDGGWVGGRKQAA